MKASKASSGICTMPPLISFLGARKEGARKGNEKERKGRRGIEGQRGREIKSKGRQAKRQRSIERGLQRLEEERTDCFSFTCSHFLLVSGYARVEKTPTQKTREKGIIEEKRPGEKRQYTLA